MDNSSYYGSKLRYNGILLMRLDRIIFWSVYVCSIAFEHTNGP